MFIKKIDLADLLEVIDCENGYVDIDHLIECCNNLPSIGMSVWCMKCENNGECMSIDKPSCFQPRQDADRKTEPSNSEKPNNCEDLQDWKDRMWAEAIVTEPTISKMEQVEDEPQTNPFVPPYDNCKTCKWWNDIIGGFGECFVDECEYEPKDEPQTDCAWR